MRFPRGRGRGISARRAELGSLALRSRWGLARELRSFVLWGDPCSASLLGKKEKKAEKRKKKAEQNPASPVLAPAGACSRVRPCCSGPQPRSPVSQAVKAVLSHRYVCLQGFFQLHLNWNGFSVNAEDKFSPGISRHGCANLSRAIPAIARRELGL